MKFVIVLACLVVAVASKEKPVILCGRQLANARVLVCYGSQFVNKRNFPENILEIIAQNDDWIEDWPWRGRQGMLSAEWQRYKRTGLADECCLKPCTTDVILNYC